MANPVHSNQRSSKEPKMYVEFARHEDLLADMDRWFNENTRGREKARAFLRELGVLSEDGKPIRLIKD